MSEKSTAKAMFTSLYADYKGRKKIREAKALMLVHQYELFKMTKLLRKCTQGFKP